MNLDFAWVWFNVNSISELEIFTFCLGCLLEFLTTYITLQQNSPKALSTGINFNEYGFGLIIIGQ